MTVEVKYNLGSDARTMAAKHTSAGLSVNKMLHGKVCAHDVGISESYQLVNYGHVTSKDIQSKL